MSKKVKKQIDNIVNLISNSIIQQLTDGVLLSENILIVLKKQLVENYGFTFVKVETYSLFYKNLNSIVDFRLKFIYKNEIFILQAFFDEEVNYFNISIDYC